MPPSNDSLVTPDSLIHAMPAFTTWRSRLRRRPIPWTIATALLLSVARPAAAQAPLAGGLPGSWVEVNGFAQRVTNDFGNWSGVYGRVVHPTARNTVYGEVLSLQGFGTRGTQIGMAHRHDWSDRVFHVVGINLGDGALILPRFRSDAQVGVRLGDRKQWQLSTGGSYVKSPIDLYDVAATASVAWFAPRMLVLEFGGRYNASQPGDVRSHRVHAVAMLTPSPRRSFSARVVGGSEGWQLVTAGTTLSRFHSTEAALAWREKLTTSFAVGLQADYYRNPFYTRSGITLGASRYW